MKSVVKLESWLSLCLLLALVSSSAAQSPQRQKPPDQPKVNHNSIAVFVYSSFECI